MKWTAVYLCYANGLMDYMSIRDVECEWDIAVGSAVDSFFRIQLSCACFTMAMLSMKHVLDKLCKLFMFDGVWK